MLFCIHSSLCRKDLLWILIERLPNKYFIDKKPLMITEFSSTFNDLQSHSWACMQRKTWSENDTCSPMFIAALFTGAKTWQQVKCSSTEEWVKMWLVYTVEYYSAIKEDKATLLQWHGGPRECHTEGSESNRGEIVYDISYMWDWKKKTDTNELTYK